MSSPAGVKTGQSGAPAPQAIASSVDEQGSGERAPHAVVEGRLVARRPAPLLGEGGGGLADEAPHVVAAEVLPAEDEDPLLGTEVEGGERAGEALGGPVLPAGGEHHHVGLVRQRR